MLNVVGNKEIDKADIRHILIRATNWVGDVVMTMPALEALKENFPASSLTVLAKPWVMPLFENHPAVDNVIAYRKGEGALTGLGEIVRVVRLVRKKKFDLAILFQNAFEAALLAYLGNVRFRVGYDTDGRGFLLTHKVIRTEEVLKVHQVDYYLSLLRAMGWKSASRNPSLYVSREDLQKARMIIHSRGIEEDDFLVGLNAGAIFGSAKRWPPERFAAIGDRAVEKWNARVMVMGSRKERDICGALCDSMSHKSLNLCGQTSLGEAMGLISLCKFFVTNDSGLMHIAAGLGVPTVAIFGPTDAVATGPLGPRTRIVRHDDVECSPCLKPECPLDHRCMLDINPDEVWYEMEKLIGVHP